MEKARIVSAKKINHLLRIIEKRPDLRQWRLAFQSRCHTRFHTEPGLIYPSQDGAIIVVCLIGSEVWYFQGGVIYALNNCDFRDAIENNMNLDLPRITPNEVEFILGLASGTGPLGCWIITGTDTVRFLRDHRAKIETWNAQLTAMLLMQKFFKRYTPKLFLEIDVALNRGIWSRLSELATHDDLSIARLVGKMLGMYGSTELFEREIHSWWSTAELILRELEYIFGSLEAEQEVEQNRWTKAQSIVATLKRVGVRVTEESSRRISTELVRHSREINGAIILVMAAFHHISTKKGLRPKDSPGMPGVRTS